MFQNNPGLACRHGHWTHTHTLREHRMVAPQRVLPMQQCFQPLCHLLKGQNDSLPRSIAHPLNNTRAQQRQHLPSTVYAGKYQHKSVEVHYKRMYIVRAPVKPHRGPDHAPDAGVWHWACCTHTLSIVSTLYIVRSTCASTAVAVGLGDTAYPARQCTGRALWHCLTRLSRYAALCICCGSAASNARRCRPW